VGFLPRKAGELDALWRELANWPGPVVAFESPQRLGASLRSLAAFDAEREVAVCRELTKRFEEVVRGTAAELAQRFATAPKGEITVVVGPGEQAPDTAAAHAAVEELVAAGTPRRVAADVVSRLTGTARNALYRATL
jgi:16S rRNA (cytidine1402-2'-O)-methyltransferase